MQPYLLHNILHIMLDTQTLTTHHNQTKTTPGTAMITCLGKVKIVFHMTRTTC